MGRFECFVCLGGAVLFLMVILIPLSFSYVEYYQYGLVQRKTTSAVDTSRVYTKGRYALGPDYRFITYQADAHVDRFDDLSVFSAGESNSSIGLEFKIDVDYTYFLKPDEIGLVHEEMPKSYRDVIGSRARDAIKNEAIFVTFQEYFQQRKEVEQRFREAVQTRWEANPSVHATLDQFNLGRIQIPENVAAKQLESKIQNERNDRESFMQEASIERELTAVEVNKINLEEAFVLKNANAQADLMRAKANSRALQVRADAQTNGTQRLMEAARIRTQEQLTSFTYIRTLTNRDNVNMQIDHFSPENILKTRQV